jgi:hydroxymethylpyrimidine/phosphomethylpyrimidine kinase
MKPVLTIAGSDSGGGAGIQADLKTFEAHGVFGLTAITCITAQNTVGVRDIVELPTSIIQSQLEAVFNDFDVAAVKIGMLGSAAIISLVADFLRDRAASIPIVLDPVMVATSGDRLLREDALELLKRELIPLATLITPNIPEGEILSGMSIESPRAMIDAMPVLQALGAQAVLLKGGHMAARFEDIEMPQSIDLLMSDDALSSFFGPYIETRHTHGTGCTLSSAIASNLANGLRLEQAVAAAKEYVYSAILHAPELGKGNGPLRHAWKNRPNSGH